jgi:hypothetical protein
MTNVANTPAVDARQIQWELRAVLDIVEATFARGTTPEELMPMWYDDEIIVAREGDTGAARGIKAQMLKAGQLFPEMGPRPKVTFRMDDSVLALDTRAVALINAEIQPDLPDSVSMDLRMMTAWRRGSRGWRIVREMCGVGSL